MSKLAAEKLIEARKSKGWNQTDMANRLGKALRQTYSLRQYQKLEEGEFPKFKREVVQELDKLLGTKLFEEIYEQNVPHGPHVDNSTDWKEEYLKLAKEHMELLKQKPAKLNLDELKELIESNSSESLRFLKVNLALLTDLYDHLVKASEKDEALSAKIEEILKED